MRQNLEDQLRELESMLPTRKRVQLLQILQALKLSLIFPLFEIGDEQGENYARTVNEMVPHGKRW